MDLDVEDVVWAKMRGYSYWPAQITVEASSGIFKKGSRSSTKLHVDFLGGEWVPKWIPQSLVRKFEAEDTGPNRKKDYRASARWEDSHLAAMKIGLDKLLQKGGLTIRTEPNQDEEFSPAQDSFITQQDTRVTQEESDDKVPTSKELSVSKNDIVTQTEDSQFYTPEQEFTLASPDQKFFTPRLNLSFPSQAKLQVNPREGRSDIKFSQEEIKLGDGQWSSTPGTTEQPGKGRLAPSKQKKTTKNKEKSVDTTWRRRSRRQIMSPCVREEPDLVSSPQLDADWKVPYKCRLCRTRFGWTADRDSHELICEGELQENVEYGLNYDVNKHSPTERKVAKNGDSTVKVDATTASQSTAKDDLTTTTQFATIVDLAKGSPVNGKDDPQTSIAENFEVKVVQSSADQKNLQFIDMELETELYVGNYAEVEWKTDDSGLEENNLIEECMVKVFDKEADSRKGILESSAGAEESIDMEENEGNDASNTSVNTGLKRRIDLQDDEKYDLTMKRRRLSVIEPVSPVRKDKNENETRDPKSDKNLNNASPVTSEMGFQDANYVCNLVIDEDCSSEEISLVNVKTTDSYENNDNASEVNSRTIDENSFDENPPINSHRLVSLDHSSVGALVRFENSRNDLESTDMVSSVESVSLKLARSSHECSHMGSHVEAFEWNDKVFQEKGSFDPPISSTKSYPKMNSLKDEKKIFAKYEDCILPPKVKTKAELKEYGYSRMIEKSNAKLEKQPHEEVKSATGNYDKVKLATKSHDTVKSATKTDDKVKSVEKSDDQGKSVTKTQDQGKLATLTDDKSATKSHVKVKSAGKSHDKIKSATKYHDNVKLATKTDDKGKSATKTGDRGKSVTKSQDQHKSAIKTDDKGKLATKTQDQGKLATLTDKSATKSHVKVKSEGKSHDKIKSVTKTDDKGKSATKSQDQGKSVTKTQDQGKSRTQAHDKVKVATKPQDQGKSRTQTHDKVKFTTKPQDQGKSRSQTHDKVKLATKIQDKGKLATQTHDKVKSKAVTRDKVKSETQTNYKVKSELETHISRSRFLKLCIMSTVKFAPEDLVLVNFPGDGFWPCRVTGVLSKKWRQVEYFGGRETGEAHLKVIREYNEVTKNDLEKYIPKKKQLKFPMLMLAVKQINKMFVGTTNVNEKKIECKKGTNNNNKILRSISSESTAPNNSGLLKGTTSGNTSSSTTKNASDSNLCTPENNGYKAIELFQLKSPVLQQSNVKVKVVAKPDSELQIIDMPKLSTGAASNETSGKKSELFKLVRKNVYRTCACLDMCQTHSCACVGYLQECQEACQCGDSCSNKGLTVGEGKRLFLATSDVHGTGCFTHEDIKQGDFVGEYVVQIVSKVDADRQRNPSKFLFP